MKLAAQWISPCNPDLPFITGLIMPIRTSKYSQFIPLIGDGC